ncbi:hypothetical protein NEHOM01_0497 [Nematocida homosporus]|uniref:uncharacterized protein n=1 Tax=Nematocida homosporus TaxID=1912981 RepID=UPI00221EF482|nr:uncharacterized protein NEHOM01_0497 [Nematocida homosporus]KAI5184946.1 hypothetical protein NEHOM01_0497 [Nematocida homosporus]
MSGNIQVRLFSDGREWAWIALTSTAEIVNVGTFTYYQADGFIHINTLESGGVVKGLSRAVVLEVLSRVLAWLDFPKIYLYARPRKCFYLSLDKEPIHPDRLRQYWQDILVDLKYSADLVGYREIRSSKATKILQANSYLLKYSTQLEDEPISRILSQNPQLSLSDLLVVLVNSKDLSEGSLIFSRPTFTPTNPTNPPHSNSSPPLTTNDIHQVSTAQLRVLLSQVESNPAVFHTYSTWPLLIDQTQLSRSKEQPTIKVIRLKRK